MLAFPLLLKHDSLTPNPIATLPLDRYEAEKKEYEEAARRELERESKSISPRLAFILFDFN